MSRGGLLLRSSLESISPQEVSHRIMSLMVNHGYNIRLLYVLNIIYNDLFLLGHNSFEYSRLDLCRLLLRGLPL